MDDDADDTGNFMMKPIKTMGICHGYFSTGIYTYIYIYIYIDNPTFRTGKSLCLDMVPSLVWRAGKSPPDLFFPTEDQFFTDHLSVDLINKSNKIP
jgi:hypothetical protein